MKNLMIVESPAKVKTLQKLVGKDYKICASVGHIKDLPTDKLGVCIEENFSPEYVVIPQKKKVLSIIKQLAKSADNIYLATDPDREGEIISWHLSTELKGKLLHRLLLHELTKGALMRALRNPAQIDMNRVEAQKTRRILDRLVGYMISPILGKGIKWGLSAGRVQSVAVRLICEREKERQNFVPQEYWSIVAKLNQNGIEFSAKLISDTQCNKIKIETQQQAEQLVNTLKNATFVITKIDKDRVLQYPPPPFTTSTLQQIAYREFSFSAKYTMQIAQQLYEGVDIRGQRLGLITYMRTDSVRIAAEAIAKVRSFIKEILPPEYLPEKPHFYKNKHTVQDAHEAIRPTYIRFTPEAIKDNLTPHHYCLYKLIWQRFLASQTAPAQINTIKVQLTAENYIFESEGSKVDFEGFFHFLGQERENQPQLFKLQQTLKVSCQDVQAHQHFTKPPPAYTEATLVKTLEERGIGRPSTYAVIIDTIQRRGYVEKHNGYFKPTQLGELVTELLVKNFSGIFDVDFTAKLEEQLDSIEEGKEQKQNVLENFYKIFVKELDKAKVHIDIENIKCKNCNSALRMRYSKFGSFLACENYPKCKYIISFASLKKKR